MLLSDWKCLWHGNRQATQLLQGNDVMADVDELMLRLEPFLKPAVVMGWCSLLIS